RHLRAAQDRHPGADRHRPQRPRAVEPRGQDPQHRDRLTERAMAEAHEECDVLIAGSGAGGLSTAVVARKLGLQVLVVEKEPVFGGTTALSGGVLWVPGHPLSPQAAQDTRAAAETYLRAEAGE